MADHRMGAPGPGWRPVRKVRAGSAGGAVAVVVLWLISLTGVTVPAEVAGAITWLVTAGMAYWVPSERRRRDVDD